MVFPVTDEPETGCLMGKRTRGKKLMKSDKSMQILYLILLFLLTVAAPGRAAAGQSDGGVEVIVPADGLTELNVKTGVCLYRGSGAEPVTVRLENPPLRLTAFQVAYDQGKQFFTAEKAVRLEAEQLVATGQTLTLTPEEVRLPKGGELAGAEPERGRLTVTGDLVYRFIDGSFRGTGGFFLEGPDWRLEGETLTGNLREGKFTAGGRLNFRYGDLSGEAETITYHRGDAKLILAGSPLLRWEEGFLQGEAGTVISYDLASGEVKVEGATKTRFYQEQGVFPSGD